jgi:serine/threonine-protein kinase
MTGQIVSHYRIIEKLGAGGMGEVYKAEDTKLQRIVALKFLSPALTSDPDAKRSFINEAQAASALDHPNICTIYEIDETREGQVFISMAYYQGETLKKKIERGPTSLREALHLIRQIGAGLAKAHEKGIVHRDIKPANLMVTEDQVIKILDFGVAKFQYKTDVIGSGIIIGTPAYMSPEQATGKPVDPRSDIWSVGVIMFELLTSSLPFEGNSDQTLMRAIVNDAPLPLNQFLGALSSSVQAIINKTLAKNPDERYPSIKDFLSDLDRLERDRISIADTAVIGVAQPAAPSIAVLPFVDLSAEKDQEYFCDGLAEEIINDLSRLKVLRIASRNSSFQFKDKNLNIAEIGRSLNVQKILEGSIRKWGNRIRIAVRLINVADGFLVWADKYERELADIFEIQDDISKSVVENLKVQLAGPSEKELRKRYTDNVEAYASYLKGRYYWNKRTAEAIKTSIDYFQSAINIDSRYALAYSGLADAYIVLGLYGRLSPVEVMPKALQAAEQALQLDEFLPEAHVSLGCARAIYEWKWSEAEAQFQRGIKLKPEYAEAHHWYAINFLTPLARFDEAEQEIKMALDLEPSSLVIHATVGLVHYYARQFDAAIEHLQHALAMNPDFAVTNLFLGQAYLQCNKFNEAIDYFQRALKFYGDSNNALANYGYAVARAGQKDVAKKVLEQLLEAAKTRYVSAYDIASVYCGLGDAKKALSWLEKAVQEHAFLLCYLNVDPLMDPLRDQKKFKLLAQKILG